MRLTFHPGQFVQLGTPNTDAYINSVRELAMHAKMFDMMDAPKDWVMVIHLGGTYCDKKSAMTRFKKRFRSLPKIITKRLVLENDEKCYDAEEVLIICEELGVPMVFDIFHYYCYKKYHKDETQTSIDNIMPRILKTWTSLNMRPKFHVSEQGNGPAGHHSIFVENLPKELLEIPDKYGVDIDIMIEAKGKDIALAHLYFKYPKLKMPYSIDIPTKLPKKAMKDLNIDELYIDDCKCQLST